MNPTAIGLDLGGFVPHVHRASGCEGHVDLADITPAPKPNLLALPRAKSHRVRPNNRAIMEACSTLRGITAPGTAFGLGRVPAWMVWEGLGADALHPTLKYTDAFGNLSNIPLSDLVEELARAAVPSVADAPDLTVVAMPDHFAERPQENLLTALPWPRDNVRLLWRSVAAVLAWTEKMPGPQMGHLHGSRVVAVDVGNTHISVTVLTLRKVERNGRQYLVPVRDLPEHRCFQRWPVRPFDLATAESLFHVKEVWHKAEQVWQLCTGSNVLLGDIGDAAPGTCDPLLISTRDDWQELRFTQNELADARTRALCDSPSELPEPLIGHCGASGASPSIGSTQHMKVLKGDVAGWIKQHGGEKPVVLVFGPVTEVKIGQDRRLGWTIVEALYHLDPREEPPFCPGKGLPLTGVVSRGCAIYGIREKMKLPTYFERLPRLCVLGEDENDTSRLIERDLIGLTDRIVEGGRMYQNHLQDIAVILKQQRAVCFVLKREDDLKQLRQEFGSVPSRDCLLSFHVAMRPAQGFARVKIIPDVESLFGNKEVVLDWAKMGAYCLPPAGRGWPDCAPLESLKGNTKSAAIAVESAGKAVRVYVESVDCKNWPFAEDYLEIVGKKLQSGRILGSQPSDNLISRLTKALTSHHQHFQQRGVYDRHDKSKEDATDRLKRLMRMATSLFARTPSWASEFLAEEFARVKAKKPGSPNPTPVFLHAAGRCFSTRDEIVLYTECMRAQFKSRIKALSFFGVRKLGMNSWCKGLQLMLRLNERAAVEVGRTTAEALAEYLVVLLEVETEENEHKHRKGVSLPYKHGMLALFYLLRFRAPRSNKGFLASRNEPDTVAWRIRQNLIQTDNKTTGWPAKVVGKGKETLQSVLLRYLQNKASEEDSLILRAAEDELESEKFQESDA